MGRAERGREGEKAVRSRGSLRRSGVESAEKKGLREGA